MLWLLVVDALLLIVDCWLRVACCQLFDVGVYACLPVIVGCLVACRWSLVGCVLMHVICVYCYVMVSCLLCVVTGCWLVVCGLPSVDCYSSLLVGVDVWRLIAECRMLVADRRSLPAGCVLLVTDCLLFTVYRVSVFRCSSVVCCCMLVM